MICENMLEDLPKLGKPKMKYISSTHRVNSKHKDFYTIGPKETFTMAEIKEEGIIKSFWLTLSSPDKRILRKAYLRIYWDDENEPSINVPIGSFFGLCFGEYMHYSSFILGATSGGYYCYLPMPFKKARIEIVNNSELEISSLYYMIGYCPFPINDSYGRLHVKWYEENPTKLNKPYVILETKGEGHFIGVVLAMEGYDRRAGSGFGFLEGNMEIWADDELAYGSTGTEDYFLSGWYFIKGTFQAPFHGLIVKDDKNFRILAYRFHILDPIPFKKRIKVLIHHGEWDEVLAYYSSIAYWYQKEPH